jgi:hypothetical protein
MSDLLVNDDNGPFNVHRQRFSLALLFLCLAFYTFSFCLAVINHFDEQCV